jgi:low affinity Fe/Cu permease
MTQKIGKYKVYENETNLKIRYIYTYSDIIGSIWFLLSFLLGLLLLFVSFRTFSFDKTNSWLILLVAIGLTLFGTYMLIAGFYNPTKGVLQIDKTKQILIIRDLLKTEIIKNELIANVTYDLKKQTRPRMLYSMLSLRLYDGTIKECFIIRSSASINTGRQGEKEIHSISRKLRDIISKAITKN